MPSMIPANSNAWVAFVLILCYGCTKTTTPLLRPNDIVETVPTEPVAVSMQLNESFGGYYISLPEHYDITTKKYPVLVFLHGAGQMGNGTTDLHYLLKDGIGKLLAKKCSLLIFLLKENTILLSLCLHKLQDSRLRPKW